ncbi:MAG TPA: pantothenate kinase [Firmicutes bacterium]|nr:pantothenate kinase [Bacillota bacterium]HAV19864.1 pantothenate kinase [Bacillota bacterium]
MIITVDLGNTALTLGIYKDDQLIDRFSTMTDVGKTISEYQLILQQFFDKTSSYKMEYEAIIISSVVPPLTRIIEEAFQNMFACPILMLGRKIKTGLAIHTDHPSEVGSDLVAASVGGIKKYNAPLVIADLGTATKIIAIDQTGAFVGVTIAPGLLISLQALVGRASQLADVNLEIPKNLIGRNTANSVNSGVLYGHAALVKGLASGVSLELGIEKPIVLTGGYAKVLLPLLPDFIYDENLVLDGLYEIYLKNRG